MPPATTSQVKDAFEFHRRGRHAEAERICRSVLSREPENFEAAHLLGIALLRKRDFDEAVRALSRAVALDPRSVDAHLNYGAALRNVFKPDEALAAFNSAITLRPDSSTALCGRGLALTDLKRFEEALESFDAAIATNTNYADAFSHRGFALEKMNKLEDAIASYDRAIALKPNDLHALNNRGVALIRAGRFAEAVSNYDRALALVPTNAGAHLNRGAALVELKHAQDRQGGNNEKLLVDALSSFDRAVALVPNNAEVHHTRGVTLSEMNRTEDALQCFERALALKPNLAESLYSRALAKLALGQMAEGWEGFEQRWLRQDYLRQRPPLRAALWAGESLNGRSIVIHEENGLGDTIQFCRYLPMLANTGAKVTFLVRPNLLRLMQGLAGPIRFITPPTDEPFDFQSGLLSLPYRLGWGPGTTPAPPYLKADPARVRKWHERIGMTGFRIGVAWHGNDYDPGRSFPLRELFSLSQTGGLRLISLQKVGGLDQLASLPVGMTVERLSEDFDSGADAFLDTAAVMESLDLVISCDTSIAHLAGALDRPAWVALKHAAEWRWMRERNDSPWYPSVRLFRQRTAGDWATVFRDIEAALRKHVSKATFSAGDPPHASG